MIFGFAKKTARNSAMALIAVALLLLVAIATTFYALDERRKSALEMVQEDALWATYQFVNETSKLQIVLLQAFVNPGLADVDSIILRHDILHSRIDLLRHGYFSRSFASTGLANKAVEAYDLLLILEQDFANLVENRDVRTLAFDRHFNVLSVIRNLGEGALIEANAARNYQTVSGREQQAYLYRILGICVAVFALVLGGVIAIQGALYTKVERSEQDLRKALAENSRTAKALESALDRAVRQEHESRLERDFFNVALSTMDQGLLMVEADGRIAIINNRATELLDLPADLVKSRPNFSDLLDYQKEKGEFIGAVGALREDIEKGIIRDQRYNYERRRPDGTVLEVRTVPITGGGTVRTFTDITATRILEEERAENQRALAAALVDAQSAARAKSDFLAVISHEIRTPLNGVLGILELMGTTRLNGRQHHMLAEARAAGEALLTLISDVLDFSKIETEHFEMQDEPFAPTALVRQVLTILRTKFDKNGVTVTSQIDAQVPEWIRGDPNRLQQVLLNLVGNAIKFTLQGSVHVRLAVNSDEPGAALLFEVIDNGVGIPEDMQARAFAPFVMLDSTFSRRSEGTGLGLAICQKIVTAMNGEIGVRSTPSLGSTFWFTVPLRPAEMTVEPDGPNYLAPAPLSRPVRILLAEDNPTNLLVARRTLEGAGHEVEAVCCGDDAVEAVRRNDYDCVLMDIAMPGMDGMQATHAIRALGAKAERLPIIAMTAYVTVDDKRRFTEAGMIELVAKPVRGKDLLAAIARCVTVEREPARVASRRTRRRSIEPINGVVLGNLIRLVGIEQARGIVGDWAADCGRAALTMVSAANNGVAGLIELEREAHRLASSAAQIGASLICEAASGIEQACRSGDVARAHLHVRRLVRNEPRTRRLLESFIAAAAA
jgi:signal transduction histidine kinase/FixJ family two-component response regulator